MVYVPSGTSVVFQVQLHAVIPVDLYLPGCPPRPEALMYSVLKLREKMSKQRQLSERYSRV